MPRAFVTGTTSPDAQASRYWLWLFVALIGAIPLFSACAHVGGWNDASRLATVESLVDHHTFSIDASMFASLTCDKIRIDGHFYSDKPPVPALWQSLIYALLQWCFGVTAQYQNGFFCYAMTVVSSGIAYVLSVVAVYRIGRRLDLPLHHCLLLAGSLALATLALVYVRQVNSHILLLAVTCWLLLGLIRADGSAAPPAISGLRACGLGMLAGLGYAIETGSGPILLLGAFGYLMWKGNSKTSLALFVLSALPLIVLHLALCYAIGHTLRPLGAVPEYLQWEGSPFAVGGLTGTWMHKHLGICLRYGLSLLLAEHGFISHQPVLWLAVLAFGLLWFRSVAQRAELCLVGFWCLGIWGLYTAASNNHAGLCCSIRWFLPLLAPAYYVLALALRECPRFAAELAGVSVWGMALAVAAWFDGPWAFVNPWLLVAVQAGALLTWTAVRLWQRRLDVPRNALLDSLAGSPVPCKNTETANLQA